MVAKPEVIEARSTD